MTAFQPQSRKLISNNSNAHPSTPSMKSAYTWCSILCMITFVSSSITNAASTTTTTVSTITSATAPAPEYLPVESLAALKSYAKATTTRASMQVYGNHLVAFIGEVRYVDVNGRNASDVINKLKDSAVFKIRATDSTKPIYAYGQLMNSDGHDLFQSETINVTIAPNGSGGYDIIDSKLMYKLAWRIPLPAIQGVNSAYVQYEENGKQWTESLYVGGNGVIFLPPNYAGKNATLIASRYTQNGYEQFAYNLSTGFIIPGKSVTGGVASSIENDLTASDKGLATSATLFISGRMVPAPKNSWQRYSAPTVTFNVTQAAGNRVCTATFNIPAITNLTTELDGIKAIAQDMEHLDAQNTFEELETTLITKTKVGSEWQVTVTWHLHNNAGEVDGTNWYCFLVIPYYEGLQKPEQSYYGPGPG